MSQLQNEVINHNLDSYRKFQEYVSGMDAYRLGFPRTVCETERSIAGWDAANKAEADAGMPEEYSQEYPWERGITVR